MAKYSHICANLLRSQDKGSSLELGIKAKSIRTIRGELSQFSLGDAVMTRADEIFQEMGQQTFRKNRRQLIIYYCIYQAYHDLGEIIAPDEIGKAMGFNRSQITQAINMGFKLRRPEHRTKVSQIKPDQLIERYFPLTKLTDSHLIAIQQLAQRMIKNSSSLLEHFPQDVSVAIIMYYLTINGVEFDQKDYYAAVNKTKASIDRIYELVCQADNLTSNTN